MYTHKELTGGWAKAAQLPRPDLSGLAIKDEHLKRALLGQDFLVVDGAMGTQLQERGLADAGQIPEMLNFSHPDDIAAIHKAYVDAGAEVITTNTFGANRLKLEGVASVEDVYRAAAECARAAGAPYIAGDVGPTGALLEPMGTMSFEEAYDLFAEQVRAVAAAGCDVVLIETMADLREAKAALLAAQENCDLPVFATMTFGEDGRTFLGTSPEVAAEVLSSMGAHAVGLNCSLGPAELLGAAQDMARRCRCPLMVQPNAGLPRVEDGVTVFDVSPEDFAAAMEGMLDAGASIIGGLFETVLGFFLKPLRRFFPSIVTGTVVLSIGLSLISVGVNAFGGGSGAVDFGSFENFCLALIVLAVILWVKHATGGFLSASSILIGIIVGYIVAAIMGLVLPTTIVNADGVEVTKAWVLNWDKVADAAWFAIPSLMPIAPVFDIRAIAPVLVMFVVTAVETVGDISGVTQGGMNREATDKELSGGVMCDGLGSTFAAFFGVLPNTSFSQNVGLVAMTKMTNRKALACGAIFLILCGLCPKLAAVVSIMPQSVLGGAAVIMFASIVVSGIQLITREPLTPRNLSIVSVALGLGYGIGANSAVLAGAPQMVSLIFGGSGIVAAAAVAILLNIVLPKDEKTFQKDASI